MIPRFIIRNPTSSLLDKLLDMGYESADGYVGDALILGRHILDFKQEIQDSPVLKSFDARYQEDKIMEQAQLQVRWQATANKVELLLGDPKQVKVIISRLGVMVDSCLLPIDQFRKLEQQLLGFKGPLIATHEPIIDRKRPFLTIGCTTLSMEDISKILTTYYSLA